MIKKIFKPVAVAAALFTSATVAFADYPERPVTLVVPFSAGGNTDLFARVAAEHLSEQLGQPVVVENRSGGGGTIGSKLVSKADADGYTLLFGTAGTHSVNPNLREVGYDPIKDFQPISVGVISSVLIVVHPSVEAKDMAEFKALTTSEKGAAMNFASGGVGTVAHVAGVMYNDMTGSKLAHIPYKGAGEAMNDVVAGRVQVYMNNIPAFLPHVAAGALRPLALAAPKRSALLPDVPTTGESGLEGFEMGSWYGLLAPAGIPAEAVDKLHRAMSTMPDSAAVTERLKQLGSEATVSESPEAFGAFIKQQHAWWGKMLQNPVFRKK
jgi:tripartite-type tricarboxylate transporter receptor subunit TctC